jgi:chromosome segregation ATPase
MTTNMSYHRHMGWKFWKRSSELTPLTEALNGVIDELQAKHLPAESQSSTSERLRDIETTVEGLELRFEQLKEECLRHLQRGSQRLKRAQQLTEEIEEEGPRAPSPQLPFPEEAEMDDVQWAQDQIRKRGEAPI